MCFWSELALFHCDGTVSRNKHLCSLIPTNDDKPHAGVEICTSNQTTLGCEHSATTRTLPHRAIYHHVCDKNAYRGPATAGFGSIRPKWKPSIRVTGDVFVTCQSGDGAQLKDGVKFQWCDGSICTLEEVYGMAAPLFCWGGVDLLELGEDEVNVLVGKGTYQYWLDVWAGKSEQRLQASRIQSLLTDIRSKYVGVPSIVDHTRVCH
jgi:hypothetical protein